jgi:hypothetical protein
MKSPPRQVSDSLARELTEQFIDGVPDQGLNGSRRTAVPAAEPVAQPATPAAD